VETLDILIRARERLETKGWIQMGEGGREGPNCLLGAIRWAIFADALQIPDQRSMGLAIGAVERVIPPRTNTPAFRTIVDWNDESWRTVEDVFAVLDSAIADEYARARVLVSEEDLVVGGD
jgi:hypothetical protein